MSRHTGEDDIVIGGARGGFPRGPLRRAIARVLAGERQTGSVTLTFLSRRAMAQLNQETFGHAGPTDVISFALPQPDGSVIGDLYLCRFVAARNALEHGCSLHEELRRLAIHGTLHVLGWDHPEGDDRTASPMWAAQERYLQAAS